MIFFLTFFFVFFWAPAPNCDCMELMVAAIGDAGTQQLGKSGWYSRMFDENKRQYYWRRYSYNETMPDAVWENDYAIWQVYSSGQRYWYIGALENRFQMNVSLNTAQHHSIFHTSVWKLKA